MANSPRRRATPTIEGQVMKIYMLMLLVSTIAALSHFYTNGEAPRREA
jgi:hypothetical protein